MEQARNIIANFAYLAGPVLACAVVTTLVSVLVMRRLGVPGGAMIGFMLAAFAVLGGISGVITGASQEAIVGAVMTALLGIVSVLLSTISAKDVDQALRTAAPLFIMGLLINALAGIAVGQNWRKKWDAYKIELADYRADYDQIWVPVSRQIRLELLKKCLAENKTLSDARKNCAYEKLAPGGGDLASK